MIPDGPAHVADRGRSRTVRILGLVAAFALGIAATVLYQQRDRLRPASSGRHEVPPLVVIGLDGADWNLIDPLIAAGKMPNLATLLRRGARAKLLTISPTLSPVIWTTIATGVKPERHGIVDFTAINRDTGEAIPVTSNLRRIPALWNRLSDAGITVGFVGWWASFPAEKVSGYVVSDRIAYQLFGVASEDKPEGKTWPPELFQRIRPLIVKPESVPDALLARFIDDPSARASTDPEIAEPIRQFKTILASTETYRRVAAQLAREFAPRVESVYFEGTDTVAHLFMRDRPPRIEGAGEESVRVFGPVIDRFYAYADELIGEIVARHGESANYLLCSDHGFRSGRDRPETSDSRIDRGRGAEWHRKYGVLVIAGPAAKAGLEVREATVYDVAPTVLALAGAPIPQNLDGRVLSEALKAEFLEAHPLRSLEPSQAERAETKAGTEPATPVATGGEAEIRERLISLGYLTQDSNNAHNNRGILLMGRGEFDAAIAEFTLAMRDNPQFSVGLINIARCFWFKGENAKAIETLGRAARIDPRSKDIPVLLGNIALKAGDLTGAEKHFLHALEIEPHDTDTLNCLGLVYDRAGDLPRAEERFRAALEIDPGFAEGHNNLGNVLKKRGDLAGAEAAYRRAIDADPFFMGAYANLALMAQERGDFDAAAELYRQALQKNNADPDLHNNLGSLLFRRGDLAGAEESFKRAIALDPKYAEGHNSIGVVAGKQGRDDEERAEYEKAIALKPGYADALYNLGLWHLRHGQIADAERRLREAVRSRPDSVQALAALGDLRLRQGDAAGALPFVERAVALQPRNARLQALFGETRLRLGDRTGGERALRLSLELEPGRKEVEDLLKSLDRP